MRALIAAALLFATTLAAHAAVETLPAGVSLRGDWQEGAVLFGKAPVGSKVWFGDRQLKLTPAGDFVFGINRDAPDSAELRVQLPGAAVVRYSPEIAKREYKLQHIDGPPPKKVTPPAALYSRTRSDQRQETAARQAEGG